MCEFKDGEKQEVEILTREEVSVKSLFLPYNNTLKFNQLFILP